MSLYSSHSLKLNSKFKIPLIYFGASFVLHLIWENFHAPLYVGFEVFGQHFLRCLYATATGDMLFMLTIYLLLAVVHQNLWWGSDRKKYLHPATWILPVVMGVLISVGFELWAVYVDHRWVYGSMPLIPVIKVGLTPVLQMIFIPLMVVFISKIFSK